MSKRVRRALTATGLIVAALVAFFALRHVGFVDYVTDQEAVRQSVQSLGLLGPALLIGLMIVAIVASPIPSAPIGLAAGAAYGPVWGALITTLGAMAGAMIAFFSRGSSPMTPSGGGGPSGNRSSGSKRVGRKTG